MKEQREALACVLKELPEGLRFFMSKIETFFPDEHERERFNRIVNESAIQRFERFANMAASEVVRTFDDNGKQKFFDLSDISKRVNIISSAQAQVR